MNHDLHAAPVARQFWTAGTGLLAAVAAAGLGCGLYRMLFGLRAVTNMNDQYPLGLWIGLDVATGVALAAGGFTSGALVYIFQRSDFRELVRPALLTALLGYTFVAIGLMFDLGRWYTIWHPVMPRMWQGNSVLFEVGMCVMIYLAVLYIEFVPVVCQRFVGNVNLPGRLARLNGAVDMALRFADYLLERTMFVFIIAGVVLSCLHQSSLGTLMVIAPYKLHPLYWSLLLPVFFLLSAVAAGLAVVIFEAMITSRVLRRRREMQVLTRLAGLMPWLLGGYILIRAGDLVLRGAHAFLCDGSLAAGMFWSGFGLLTLVPWGMFMSTDIRQSPGSLFAAAAMYVAGVCLNRCTVFFIAYQPAYATHSYVPALGEFVLTAGLVAAFALMFRFLVLRLPVLSASE